MQRSLFIFSLLLYLHSVKAQFSAVHYADSLSQFQFISQVKSADFNNDGLPDIITSVKHFPTDSLMLYTAMGNNIFSRQIIPGIQVSGAIEYFEVADINDDGKVDIAVITNNATAITWYQNSGSSFIEHPLASGLDFTTMLLIKDFDRNGLPDILALQHVEIVLYLQSAETVFEPGRAVHGGTEFYAIDAGYYNRDSLPDIAVASGGFEVLVNTGGGNFSVQSQAGLGLCFGLQSADLDNDNDIDIGMYEPVTGIMFYKNDGNGNFSFADTIVNSVDNFETFGFADFDCDSDYDLYTTITQQGRIVWVENRLAGGFGLPANIHVQNGELVEAITAADLDVDGKTDIVWGNKHLGINTNSNACPFCVVIYRSSLAGSSYQWQVDTGTGFSLINNDAVYTGTDSDQLQLTAPPTNWYGNKYRCVVNGNDTGEIYVLKFAVRWTGAFNNAWENPANWSCGILPDAYTDVTIEGNTPNNPEVNTNQFCRSLLLLQGAKLLTNPGADLQVTGK